MADNVILRDALDAHESLHDFAETDKSFAESVDFLEAVEAKRRRRADSKHSAKIAAVADAQQPTKTVAGAWHVAQPLQQLARRARRLSFLFLSSFECESGTRCRPASAGVRLVMCAG